MNPDPIPNRTDWTQPVQPMTSPALDPLQILRRQFWILVAGGVLGLLIGIVAYQVLGPEFHATAHVLVSKRDSVLTREEESPPTTGERTEHITLIMSPYVVDRAVQNHQLDQLPSLSGDSSATEDILSGLTVRRSAGQDGSLLNVLDIGYSSSRLEDAHTVVEAVMEAYREYLMETHRDSLEETRQTIARARTRLQDEIRSVEEAYAEFRQEAPRLIVRDDTTDQATNPHSDAVRMFEQERQKLLLERSELESRKVKIQAAIADQTSPGILDLMVRRFLTTEATDPAGRNLPLQTRVTEQQQILPLLLKLTELERDYGVEHPSIVDVKRQIAVIREFYDGGTDATPGADTQSVRSESKLSLVREYLQLLDQQIEEFTLREQRLAKNTETESKSARELEIVHTKDAEYRSELSRLRERLSTIADRDAASAMQIDNPGYEVALLSPIETALAWKRIVKVLAVGVASCVLLAALIALWRELRDKSIRTVQELRHQISLPVFGSIPETVLLEESGSLAETRVCPSLCLNHAPESIAAEAFRTLRSTVLARLGQRRVLGLTAAESGDGTSCLLANLAVAVSQLHRRVLIIDANLRTPRMHTMFQTPHTIGLADVLKGDIEVENAIQQTLNPSLMLLTAGELADHPSELLSSPRFNQMLAGLRNEFDLILIDSSPVLSFSDACIVSTGCDGLLLLARMGHSSRTSMKRACELLEAHNIHPLGVIVNGLQWPRNLLGPRQTRLEAESTSVSPAVESVTETASMV